MDKIKKTVIALISAFALTGCMKMDMTFNVESAEKMTMGVELLLSPELYAEVGDSLEQSAKETIETDAENVKVEVIEKNIDDETWKGVFIQGDVTGEDLSAFVKEDGDNLVFTLSKDDTNELLGEETMGGMTKEDIESYLNYGFSMNIHVSMPNTPTTNIGTVNGNTVDIDLLSDEYLELSDEGIIISCSNHSQSVPYVPIVLGCLVVVAGLAGLLLFKNKKDKK